MKPDMLAAALDYAKRGFFVFPCKKKLPLTENGFYDATTDEAQIKEWWRKDPLAQIALPMGRKNNLFALDLDSQQAQEYAKRWNLPETFTVETRPGRKQLWFRQPLEIETKCTAELLAPKIDTRGDGGYVIAPPSIHHETGQPYRVVKDVPYADASLLPAFILRPEKQNANGSNGTSPKVTGDKIPRGSHDSELTRIAGRLRHDGLEENAITLALIEVCEKRCEDHGPDHKQMCAKIARSVCNYAPGGDAVETTLVIESFATVQAKPLEWLWPDRIPKNKLTIFSGNPDVGKTTVMVDMIARVTTSRDYPDGAKNTEPPGEVLALAAEDALEDTLKPRLLAAGADVSKVHYVKCVEIRKGAKKADRMLALDTDLELLEKALKDHPAIRLVVFDPVTGYLGKADLNKEQELRRVLTPIRDLAEQARVTIVGLGHFNKRSDVTALHRVGGAVAMSGIPRAVWLFVKDPEEPGLYKMLLGKGNLTKKRTGLKYRFAEKILETGGAPIIAWGGETGDDAEDAVNATSNPEARKLSKAKALINEYFAKNPLAQPSEPIIEAAATKGISKPTLFRARKELNISASRRGGAWLWEPNA